MSPTGCIRSPSCGSPFWSCWYVAQGAPLESGAVTAEQWSALLSLLAALVITLASFRQWVSVQYDGGMPLRSWAKAMLLCVVALLVGALALFAYALVRS